MAMDDTTLIDRLKEFIKNEGKSCSFDPGLITAEYVYRTKSTACLDILLKKNKCCKGMQQIRRIIVIFAVLI